MYFPLEKRWEIARPIPESIRANFEGYSDVMAQLLYNRGFADNQSAEVFLRGANTLNDPFLLKDMDVVVKTILEAVDRGEKIAVFGDYDVDGITATALLTQVLEKLGANVIPYIPDRFKEGYGVNVNALETLHEQNVDLIITVDCGIRSPNELHYACDNLGMKVIISDHHTPEEQLPRVQAIICQKQPGDEYPEKNLAGVGLAYKIGEALLAARPAGGAEISDWLDLVALGTVADVVPLTGENRSFVRRGLLSMRTCKRPGLRALMQVAGIKKYNVTAMDISFGIAPRLNAAGRILSNHALTDPVASPPATDPNEALALENGAAVKVYEEMQKALKILMTRDEQTAGLLAQELDDLNRHRQKLTHEMQKKAEMQINTKEVLLYSRDEGFNSGLVGLVAAKLTESYYRPTIIGFKGKENTRASCRSIPEFNITQALDRCKDLLLQHGGHAMAAGFTVENEKWEELVSRLHEIACECLAQDTVQPKLAADMDILLREIPNGILEELDAMEPIGAENPPPLFVSRKVKVTRSRAVGADEKHLKLTLKDGMKTFDAIAFNQGYWAKVLPPAIDILYQIERNFFNGNIYTQLNIKDIKASV